jgi:tryptophanyl-tRNA synthetase
MHAITVPQKPQELRTKTREAFAILLACGIDPKKSLVYIQSHVPAHAELSWILNCVTPVGWLTRMTQYKDKSSKQESVSTGLLDYPVLQAADILLYKTDLVPTGEDQRQHIELTRDIAARFNNIYGDIFRLPGALIPKVGAKIVGLDDPTVKMSKSLSITRPNHAVAILAPPDRIRKTLRVAITDSGNEIKFSDSPEKAGVNNLLTIYHLLSGQTKESVEDHFSGKGYRALKEETAEVLIESLRPIQSRYNQLIEDQNALDEILHLGSAEAADLARQTLDNVRAAVGFLPSPHCL